MVSKMSVADSEYWGIVEQLYDFVLCFEIESGEILRKSGFDQVCVLLDSYKNYYLLMDEYKKTYVNDLTRDEFNLKTSLDYLKSHETVKFIGLENIEDNAMRWYEYSIVINDNIGAMFIQDIHQRQTGRLKLEKASKRDYLTNTLNRRAFDDHVDRLIINNRKFSLLFIDIDDFKYINDTYSHSVGDCVLKDFSDRLKVMLSEGTISRYGGDEFIVAMENKGFDESIDNVKVLIDSMNHSLDCGIKISISIGVSVYPHDGTSRKEMFHAADIALYNAKRSGKKTYKAAEIF